MTNAEKLRAALILRAGVPSMQNLHYHIVRNWNYGVVTFECHIIGLYKDGVPVATKSATASPKSDGKQTIRMGADSQCLNNYFVR